MRWAIDRSKGTTLRFVGNFSLPRPARERIRTRGSYGNCSAHEALRSEARKKKRSVSGETCPSLNGLNNKTTVAYRVHITLSALHSHGMAHPTFMLRSIYLTYEKGK